MDVSAHPFPTLPPDALQEIILKKEGKTDT